MSNVLAGKSSTGWLSIIIYSDTQGLKNPCTRRLYLQDVAQNALKSAFVPASALHISFNKWDHTFLRKLKLRLNTPPPPRLNTNTIVTLKSSYSTLL